VLQVLLLSPAPPRFRPFPSCKAASSRAPQPAPLLPSPAASALPPRPAARPSQGSGTCSGAAPRPLGWHRVGIHSSAEPSSDLLPVSPGDAPAGRVTGQGAARAGARVRWSPEPAGLRPPAQWQHPRRYPGHSGAGRACLPPDPAWRASAGRALCWAWTSGGGFSGGGSLQEVFSELGFVWNVDLITASLTRMISTPKDSLTTTRGVLPRLVLAFF